MGDPLNHSTPAAQKSRPRIHPARHSRDQSTSEPESGSESISPNEKADPDTDADPDPDIPER
jgi:hypothetical protein